MPITSKQVSCRPLSLADLLDAVPRQGTRLELLCWQMDVDERQVLPAWSFAIRERLIERRGNDPLTGRARFGLSGRGEAALRRLKERRRGARRPQQVTSPGSPAVP